MPGCRYQAALIILSLFACFHIRKKDNYKQGLLHLQQGQLAKAENEFLIAIARGDSVERCRGNLIKIYRLRGDSTKIRNQYLALLRDGIVTEDAIKYLADYYEKSGKFHNYYLILRLGASRIPSFGKMVVNRSLLSKLLTGLMTRRSVKDPVGWVIRKGILVPMPDGNFYPDDTVRVENLAVVLSPYLPDPGAVSGSLYPLGYPLAKIEKLGFSSLIYYPSQPLRLKDAFSILDRAKNYLR
ncbi:MAG TPA: S-layer homology domain-containing protein [bacterium (Candidatus Stahlbacteria)]|nr:S-layer homology domain-containing protein [Candidatus Stahlbacteria bacterium]